MGTGRSQQLTRRVARTAQQYDLLGQEKRIVVGLSGGSDSTALLYLLHYLRRQFPFQMVAAHLHHGIRGRDADGDAAFCAELAAVLNIPLETARCPVPLIARKRNISLEMAARECRHRFFREVCRRARTRTVALAHTADDQAETVLMKWCRGSGLDGIAGMPYDTRIGDLRMVRPLLDIEREELRTFLEAHNLSWREDASNADCRHLRNRVRHIVLPCIAEHVNPGIRQTLARTARILQDENQWIESLVEPLFTLAQNPAIPDELDGAALRKMPAAARRRILRRWVREQSRNGRKLNFDMTDTLDRLLCLGEGSRRVHLEGGESVAFEYDRVSFRREKKAARAFAYDIGPGTHLFPSLNLQVTLKAGRGILKPPAGVPGALPAEASLDRRLLDGGLCLRSFQPGDRMYPTGMKGSRKLKDIFIDAKVPRATRGQIPVFTHGGRVAWVPGCRIDRRFSVSDNTTLCAHLSVQPM